MAKKMAASKKVNFADIANSKLTWIAILIVLAGIISLFFFRGAPKAAPEMPESIDQINSKIESCIESTLESGVADLLSQGGIIFPVENYFTLARYNIAYWSYTGKDLSRSTQEVERELSKFMEEFLPYCTNFEKEGINVDFEIIVLTKIDDDAVTAQAEYTGKVIEGKAEYEFSKTYSENMRVRLGEMVNLANRVISEQESNPKELCLDCLIALGKRDNLDVIITFVDETALFTIIEEGPPRHWFNFASKIK